MICQFGRLFTDSGVVAERHERSNTKHYSVAPPARLHSEKYTGYHYVTENILKASASRVQTWKEVEGLQIQYVYKSNHQSNSTIWAIL